MITKEQYAQASFEIDEDDNLSFAKLNDESYIKVEWKDADPKLVEDYLSEANVYLAMPREQWPKEILEKLNESE